MRLHRPYIPVRVRAQVVQRQLDALGIMAPRCQNPTEKLRVGLAILFGDKPYALDHDPALVNRKRYVRNGKTFYQPPANDPDHLIYREAGRGSDHDIKTRVRGDGALRSDLGQARYNKRVAKNRARGFKTSTDKSRPKRKWGSRPLQSRSTFERRP